MITQSFLVILKALSKSLQQHESMANVVILLNISLGYYNYLKCLFILIL